MQEWRSSSDFNALSGLQDPEDEVKFKLSALLLFYQAACLFTMKWIKIFQLREKKDKREVSVYILN